MKLRNTEALFGKEEGKTQITFGSSRELLHKYRRPWPGLVKLKSIFMCIVFYIPVDSALAQGPENKKKGLAIMAGVGVVSGPTYLGSDDYQTSLFPNIALSYGDRLSVSFRGVEYAAISASGWQAGPTLSFEFGREEQASSPLAIAGDDSDDLDGLGDIDPTLELGGFVEYKAKSFAAKLALRQGVSGGHDGLAGKLEMSYRAKISGLGLPMFVSIGPEISFADAKYNSTYFDVSAAQSIASGISQYDAGAGLNSIGLRGNIMMPLSRKTSLMFFVGYEELTDDLKDSSIVSERGSSEQLSTGIFINYKF